jgi:ribosome maturation factor RimP
MSTDSPLIQRVLNLVAPIASDLNLDLYDVEQRGGTLRITLDTRPGQPGGVDLEQLSLATRLISRELDHNDPVPGKYTLEVTSPGVERTLRTPAHFQREIGKTISVRLANVDADQRRLEGVLIAADDHTATIRGDDGVELNFAIDAVDRARTVFVWGPQPKPGQPKPGTKKASAAAKAGSARSRSTASSAAEALGVRQPEPASAPRSSSRSSSRSLEESS